VKVSIIDEGPGISPEHHEHIFDPFFTTKPNGKGLGLAIAYTTIKNHGGYIGLDTKFENGTKIDIYIPESEDMILLEEEVSAESSQEAGLYLTQLTDDEELSEEQRAQFGRKIRVLIMDDERAIREVAGKLLVHHGYEVDFAETGEQALNVYKNFKKLGNTFDIVIMDLNIPEGMGGKETIVKLLELDPDAKAILSTGLTNDPIIDSYTQHGFKGLVTKPYQIEELNNAIRKVFSQN